MAMKKGYFFTIDALLALFILVTGFLLLSNLYVSTQPRTQLNYYSEDMISLFSDMKVGELNNTYLQKLIDDGNITDMDNTILEQIGIFWVTNRTGLARNLAQNISGDLIPDRFGFSFIVGNDVVYSQPKGRSDELVTFKNMITGIEKSRPIKGTAVRIYLNQISSMLTTRYAYLGGFVGQGNVSTSISSIPADANITEMYLEMDAADDFSLYINGIFCNNFSVPPGNLTSEAWEITYCNGSINKGGNNDFFFRFAGQLNRSYIGGGFIKVTYLTKNIYQKNMSAHTYYFPGIEGVVNLYDGFDVPGTLNNMEIYLHYLANHSNSSNNTFYVTIGNITIYRDNFSNSTMNVYLNNSMLSGLLNFTSLSNQTVPIRAGFENLSYQSIITDKGNGDVVAITDVSGSMDWEFDSSSAGAERFCKDLSLNDLDSEKLSVAKCILKTFSHDILYNITGNRVGLTTYYTSIRNMLGLGTNLTALTDDIDSFYANGGTCTSCGVLEASGILLSGDPVDMLSKAWKYSNDYQYSDPAGWSSSSFDDSSWPEGLLNFGFGQASDYYTGNVIQADLWDHPNDVPAPVDFTTGINSLENTFGFISADVVENLLNNSYFDGPSTTGWAGHGNINLSDPGSSEVFNDDFETSLGWSHAGTNEQWQYGTPLGRGGGSHGNPDPDYAHSGSRIWGEDCINPSWNGDYQSNADSRLTSPAIDCTSCTDTVLRFYRWLNVEQPAYDQARVRVTDSGGNWHTVWTNPTEMTDNSWNMQETDISAYADNNPNLRVRFGTQSDGSWQYSGWNIDDVAIVSQSGTGDIFGLQHYWFVDSGAGSYGSLSQDFQSPSDSPNNVTLNLVHSINSSHFDGTADVFCNLTYPGGESSVWSEHWAAGSLPPDGPVNEAIDLTPFITSSTFTYVLECGADLSGPGETLVAFDNITVIINWTNNGDDGWDWQEGVYGYAGNMNFFPAMAGDLELVADRTSNDASGSYGIQVNITQDMIDAMNSAGGGAWLSFNYRWDARDDGTASVFDTDDQVWIKGYLEKPSTAVQWLGSEMSSEGGDASPEIWTANDPDTEGSGLFAEDISSYIDEGPGFYYIALGGKLRRDSASKYGSISFDNIQLAFTNDSGNTFYRNRFFVNDPAELHSPISLTITSDSGADVYLNGNLIDSYAGAQSGRNIAVVPGDFSRGDNILAIKLKNSDSSGRLNARLTANITDRQKAMVIMSDGISNACVGSHGSYDDGNCDDCGRACCPGSDGVIDNVCPHIPEIQASGDLSSDEKRAAEQLINISCYYNKKYGISLYTVAFGDVGNGGELALNLTALCDPDYTPDEPHFFTSSDPEGLAGIYGQIANELRLIFSLKKSQIISFQGAFEESYLYHDSYIALNYTPIIPPIIHGEVPIFFESPDFGGCTYDLQIPSQIRPLEAYLLAYSGEHWTDYVAVTNSKGTHVAYNLSRFNTNYANLGDPFPIPIPGPYFERGETNTIIVRTGDNSLNSSNCSTNTTMLYTGLLNMINFTDPYSSVHPNATGCNWTIEHELGYNFTLSVPTDYAGPLTCVYTNSSHGLSGFDNDDSYDWAMYNFLVHLDYNNDGRIFINFGKSDFIVNSWVVHDVPYLWGPTIAEVRVWQ